MSRTLSLLKYQLNRVRNVWWGRDEAVLRRLQKSGKVVYGTGTYGIPTIHDFPYSTTRLIVGNYSSISGHYLLGGQHSVEQVTTYPMRINFGVDGAGEDGVPVARDDIRVGSDAWTAYGAWIQAGVTIGDGAVVATGALVTKDVPPFAIVGGVPAKVIRYRHTEEQRAALLELRWWDWPVEEIRAAIPLLASTDIDAFIESAHAKGPGPSSAVDPGRLGRELGRKSVEGAREGV
jgi:acetyltransferase-like isoleucine patch superfamily enzyme